MFGGDAGVSIGPNCCKARPFGVNGVVLVQEQVRIASLLCVPVERLLKYKVVDAFWSSDRYLRSDHGAGVRAYDVYALQSECIE